VKKGLAVSFDLPAFRHTILKFGDRDRRKANIVRRECLEAALKRSIFLFYEVNAEGIRDRDKNLLFMPKCIPGTGLYVKF
jgi:hypothetical protein